jgi:hypothetical protein
MTDYDWDWIPYGFLDDTLITMADGSKRPLRDIVVGDRVRDFNPSWPGTWKIAIVTRRERMALKGGLLYFVFKLQYARNRVLKVWIDDEQGPTAFCDLGNYNRGFVPFAKLTTFKEVGYGFEGSRVMMGDWPIDANHPDYRYIESITSKQPSWYQRHVEAVLIETDHWRTFFANGVGVR